MSQNLEYIFTDEMTALLDHFTSLTEVRIAFFSLDGEELCIGKDSGLCGYCALRRRSLRFRDACLADDAAGRQHALETGSVHFYPCHAGLGEAVMPVFMGPAHIGYAMIGQFRLKGNPVAVRTQRQQEAVEQLPEFSRAKVDDLLSMFQVLIQHIANQGLVGRRDYDLLGPLLERMQMNPHERLSLKDAAQVVGLSSSRLSHLFTSTLGISFKQYQIRQRLKLADRLLTTNPDWRITRVAEACGFDDPLYFSRTYKKHRGVSPSQCRLV
jgi:AraC-like DNA-binding protein/ligand-binding sensor protein